MNLKYARRSEDTEQITVIQWARYQWARYPELELLHHCPNGGSRNKAEAVKLKQMGVKAGMPDLCLPVPKGKYAGLYIEMKYDKGKLRDSQKEILHKLADIGHYVAVCYGAEEAIKVLEEYCRLLPLDTGNKENEMKYGNRMVHKGGEVRCITGRK